MLFGVRRQLRQFWRSRILGKNVTLKKAARYAQLADGFRFVFLWNTVGCLVVYTVFFYRSPETGELRMRTEEEVGAGLKARIRHAHDRPTDEQLAKALDEEA